MDSWELNGFVGGTSPQKLSDPVGTASKELSSRPGRTAVGDILEVMSCYDPDISLRLWECSSIACLLFESRHPIGGGLRVAAAGTKVSDSIESGEECQGDHIWKQLP